MRLSPILLALAMYHFPADHFNHRDYQTEWWYYTGNLHDKSGHHYGFELTFFRQAVPLPQSAAESTDAVWRPDQIYLAHLALTDVDGHRFYHTERLNRAGPGIAGAEATAQKYWNGNWQVRWKTFEPVAQELQAVSEQFTLTLDLTSHKPPVINGVDGISQKGPAKDEASHYISFTHLNAKGRLNGTDVDGIAWMDHEYFNDVADPELAGWDWFAVQLENNEELMLYRLRTKNGEISPYSSGTYVDAQGVVHHLFAKDIQLVPVRFWGKYPVDWQIAIPSLGLNLHEQTTLDDQELRTPSSASPSPTYWEGAVTYSGTNHGQAIQGVGYLELTGYSAPLRLGH